MKVLYLCTGNSARSIMAEAITRALLPPNAPLEIHSAGVSPKGIHPETEAVLREAGVGTEGLSSKGIDQVPFGEVDLVVTLCDDARRSCPAPPPRARRIHWGLRDPAAAEGGPEAIHAAFRAARDEITACVKRLLFELATTRDGR